MARQPRPQTLEQAFWRYAEKRDGDECWIWSGVLNPRRYGIVWFNRQRHRASRVSWSIANSHPWPEDMIACHTCDNPQCVNPSHIWPGTKSANARDADNKGRMSRKIVGEQANTLVVKQGFCAAGHELTGYNHVNGRFCRTCRQSASRRAMLIRRIEKTIAGMSKAECIHITKHINERFSSL